MLDSLLKRIFRREVEKKVENAVTGVVHTALNSGQNQPVAPQAPAGQSMTTPVAAQVIDNATSPEREWDIDYKHDIDYFRPILAKYFPEYTVEENVPFATVVPGQRSISAVYFCYAQERRHCACYLAAEQVRLQEGSPHLLRVEGRP